MLRALFPQAVFMPTQRSLHATVKLHSQYYHTDVQALVDSGATDNFISPTLVKQCRIHTRTLEEPRTIRNVDGTKNTNGEADTVVLLEIKYKGNFTAQTFFVIDLGDDRMLLGMPFLAATNPEIDWTRGIFPGDIQAATPGAVIKGAIIAATRDAQEWTPHSRSKPLTYSEPPKGYDHYKSPIFLNVEPEDYAFIRRTTKATTLAAEAADKTKRTWQEQVPMEYHKYGKVFSEKASHRFPGPRPWDHAIDLMPNAPKMLDCKTYPLAIGQQDLLDQFLAEHLQKGYIRTSKSPYASPFFFIKKKDGKHRPVQDYRKLNEVTVRNTYPLPLIKELIHQLVGKQWFTKFDIRWGYNNVRIKEGDEWKAAFKTNRGLFEPTVMFFGLTNSPATFQTMMDAIFREEVASGDVIIYMDDILIATTGSLDHHRNMVAHILSKLREHDLFLKPEKCHFHKQEVEYLGVIVGKGHVKMDPVKVQAITDWPTPTNLHELRSFLGFGNYYKDFIPAYSHITRPLHDLTKKNTPWHWDDSQRTAFHLLKEIFTSYPVLRNPDSNKRYIVDTDASQFAVGATISQDYPDGRHPIAYFSKSLLEAELNYDIYDRELLAIIYTLKAFNLLLKGAKEPFLIRSDHQNLLYFKSPQKISARQARWHQFLQEYDFELVHFPGKSNTIADLLSRRQDFKGGVNPNEHVTILPDYLFARKIYLEDNPETRRQVLHQIHDSPVGGHPGISNTWSLVKRRYQGPRLHQFVENYVKGCAKCQESKVITHMKRAPLYPFDTHVEQGPFQYVSMDLITDLPRSNRYDAILTIVDQGCSKAAKFLPCNKTIDGQGVAQLYFEHLFPWFGIPKRIISDRDPRFTSHFAKAVCKATGIQQNISTAFHPRTDGQTERMNRWIEDYLRQFVIGRQNNWSTLLPVAEFAHNSWKHEHTKHTPHELITGINPIASIDTPDDSVPAAQERLKQVQESRSDAQKALQRRIKPLNLPRSFVIGDKVWLDARNLKVRTPSRKLSPRRYGPYQVLKQMSPVTYRLQLPKSLRIHDVFHVDLLIPYHETEEHGANYAQPPPELVDGEEEYEVEDIINERTSRRKKQYLVKWAGYPASENSWVNEKDLHSPELLEEYRQSKERHDTFSI
jgi:hypothetical protein